MRPKFQFWSLVARFHHRFGSTFIGGGVSLLANRCADETPAAVALFDGFIFRRFHFSTVPPPRRTLSSAYDLGGGMFRRLPSVLPNNARRCYAWGD